MRGRAQGGIEGRLVSYRVAEGAHIQGAHERTCSRHGAKTKTTGASARASAGLTRPSPREDSRGIGNRNVVPRHARRSHMAYCGARGRVLRWMCNVARSAQMTSPTRAVWALAAASTRTSTADPRAHTRNTRTCWDRAISRILTRTASFQGLGLSSETVRKGGSRCRNLTV